jgi:hypothetical protein
MQTADRLEQTLQALADAARHGRLAEFDVLSDSLSEAVAALEADPPGPIRLRMLREAAEEVAVLLMAAGRGLDAARQRLGELDALRKGFVTYGDDGRRQRFQVPNLTDRRI